MWIWYCGGPGPSSRTGAWENKKEFETWCRLAPGRVFVWTYDFINNQPEFSTKPALFTASKQLRNLHRYNGWGAFLQCGENWDTGAPFCELQNWVLAKLLWDPTANVDLLVEEFMRAYYGQAAEHVAAYRELNHALYLTHDPSSYRVGAGQSGLLRAIGEENFARLEGLLDRAEEAADDDVIRRRVRLLRLPFWHYRLSMRGLPWFSPGGSDEAERAMNSQRRWYRDDKHVNEAVRRLTETDEFHDIIDNYVTTMRWRDVRSFREQSAEKWLESLEQARKKWQQPEQR